MSQPWWTKTSAERIALFLSRRGFGPKTQISRALIVFLGQCWSQFNSFCAGSSSLRGGLVFSLSGAGRLRPNLSKRFATAVVLSFFRRDHRKQALRRGVLAGLEDLDVLSGGDGPDLLVDDVPIVAQIDNYSVTLARIRRVCWTGVGE